MIDPQSLDKLGQELTEQMRQDRIILNDLRAEIRPLKAATRRIQPRSTTAISLVAADGGNNRLEFDPFMVQLLRVVDSSNNEYCLEAVTPTTDTRALSLKQMNEDGSPRTAMGAMMQYLGVKWLWELTPMIPGEGPAGRPVSPSWVQVYRELVEWAILFHVLREKDFGSDTLLVRDGFLRSKVFAKDLFGRYRAGIDEGIKRRIEKDKRRLYFVGIAKHSKVLQRYRLAMALEGVMDCAYPCYVEIPRELEAKAYVWSEYARGSDMEGTEGEINKFVAGKMFFVKFGGRPRDPIWAVDLFEPQKGEASAILGYLLNDATDGFPVPFYPQCLQRAHENAALVDFDQEILQQGIFNSIREALGSSAPVLDIFRLAGGDPSAKRYS